jgi:hypothetical protein
MKKRIAVIGKGTAGSQAVSHFSKYLPEWEVQWHFDEAIPTQAVGEGSTIQLPQNLFFCNNFDYSDLEKIDGTVKLGIKKVGWGSGKNSFLHSFPPPVVSLHFSAKSLQNYIYENLKDTVQIFDHSVQPEDIDSDYVVDCSGKPSNYDLFNQASHIPVNSAYVTQCYWDYPRFQHTLTIARPYGWVFGIPLQNRCSIGYIFNRNFNKLDEIKEDVKEIFAEYSLSPSENTNYIEFNNYYRKVNFTERVSYSGNASFFLEPLEATSMGCMNSIQRGVFDIVSGTTTPEACNTGYLTFLKEVEVMIMLHYFAGSQYKTKFWEYAMDQGRVCVENALKNDQKFKEMVTYAINTGKMNLCASTGDYGSWWPGSWSQNIEGLKLEKALQDLMDLT